MMVKKKERNKQAHKQRQKEKKERKRRKKEKLKPYLQFQIIWDTYVNIEKKYFRYTLKKPLNTTLNV